MSSSSTPPPPPKATLLPWTHEETISLIESYRDKWYSLNKGHLKASQWDQVAQAVPSKTPIQCRHKIEKLRKRYRSELQKPFPYTWHYFQIMHQMEQGPLNPTPITALDPHNSTTSEDDDEEWSASKAAGDRKRKTADDDGTIGGDELELAEEIKGFAERFVRMENRKIEMMRETERLRMEMERKKMDMILHAQRKIVRTICQVFASST